MRLLFFVGILGLAAHAGPDDSFKRWTAPKRGTFNFKQEALSTVVGEIENQCGLKIELAADGDRRVDLEAKGVAFFEAIEQLARKNGLMLTQTRDKPLVLADRPEGMPQPHVMHLGPSRLSLEQAIRAKGSDETELLKVELRWLVPEGIECALVEVKLDRVVDDEGRVYEILAERYAGLPVTPNESLTLNMTPPSRTATRIAKLSGTLVVAFAAKRGSVEFTKADFGASKRLGQSTITLHGIDASPPTVHFSVEGWACLRLRSGDYGQPWFCVLTKGSTGWGNQVPTLRDIGLSCYDKSKAEIGRSSRTKSGIARGSPRWTHWIGVEKEPSKVVISAVTKLKVRSERFVFLSVPLE